MLFKEIRLVGTVPVLLKRKSQLIVWGLLLFSGRIAFSDDLITKDYSLTDGGYPAIALACVGNFTEDFYKWFREVATHNPTDSSKISYSKVSTIEVSVPLNGDLGSSDPFFLAARKRAASLGANLLKYESGVVNKNTQRIYSETFTTYRVQFGDFTLSGGDLASLSMKSYSKDDIYAIGFNFGYCNGDIILDTDPAYKNLGSDAYYLLNGQYYIAGCTINGKRIEDVAKVASTKINFIQTLGLTPSKKCQSELKQESNSQDNQPAVAVTTLSFVPSSVEKKPRVLQYHLDNGRYYRKIGNGPWTPYDPPLGQSAPQINQLCSSHDDLTKSDLENIYAWEKKCFPDTKIN